MTKITDRMTAIIGLVATLFIKRAKEKVLSESYQETVIDVIEEILLGENFMNITFTESIDIVHDHLGDIMDKVIRLAHASNPTHECVGCVLMYLCGPDAEAQVKHKKTKDEVGELEGFLTFLEKMLDINPEDGQPNKASEESTDEQFKTASDILKGIMKKKTGQ